MVDYYREGETDRPIATFFKCLHFAANGLIAAAVIPVFLAGVLLIPLVIAHKAGYVLWVVIPGALFGLGVWLLWMVDTWCDIWQPSEYQMECRIDYFTARREAA